MKGVMQADERRAVLILADISGYTKYMVANQTTAVHGQQAITFLIETILAEVDIPLTLHAIEGDALFLSASHPGDDEGWKRVLADVRAKLPRFFHVFLEGIVRSVESTPCTCGACRNLEELRLKIIVHSGRAVYHTIAGLAQIAGTDVILAHRLLKNSVPSNEYLLMTDAAFQDLGRDMEGPFVPGEEDCEGIGRVKTWVKLMGPAREQARDALYSKTDAELEHEALAYVDDMRTGLWPAIVEQWKHPRANASFLQRLTFAAGLLLRSPSHARRMQAGVHALLLAKRDARRKVAHASGA
jgi:hypothetical protein